MDDCIIDFVDKLSKDVEENILNRTPEQINPKLFVSHLGPKSREYAWAWDEFTGIQTERLKIDDE